MKDYFICLGAANWELGRGCWIYNNYAKGKKKGVWILKIATKIASIGRELGLDRGWALEKVSKHGQEQLN